MSAAPRSMPSPTSNGSSPCCSPFSSGAPPRTSRASGGAALTAAAVVAVAVVVQSAWLQPELDEARASIIAGIEPPPSHLHTVYGIVEVTKVGSLGLLAAWATRGPGGGPFCDLPRPRHRRGDQRHGPPLLPRRERRRSARARVQRHRTRGLDHAPPQTHRVLGVGPPRHRRLPRQPLRRHADTHAAAPLTSAHFERWLTLFNQTLAAGWNGPNTERARALARNVARVHATQLGVTPPQEPPDGRRNP